MVVVSVGSIVTFQVSGSIDTMESDAAATVNTTATIAPTGVFPIVMLLIVVIAIIGITRNLGGAFR